MKTTTAIGAAVALWSTAAVGCGENDIHECQYYAEAFRGTMTGTMDGQAFAANVEAAVYPGTEIELQDDASYHGRFSPTQGTQVTTGEAFFFGVDCATGEVIEVAGFYEDTDVADYARGNVAGRVGPDGGSGTWDCTYGCVGSGTWTVE